MEGKAGRAIDDDDDLHMEIGNCRSECIGKAMNVHDG